MCVWKGCEAVGERETLRRLVNSLLLDEVLQIIPFVGCADNIVDSAPLANRFIGRTDPNVAAYMAGIAEGMLFGAGLDPSVKAVRDKKNPEEVVFVVKIN